MRPPHPVRRDSPFASLVLVLALAASCARPTDRGPVPPTAPTTSPTPRGGEASSAATDGAPLAVVARSDGAPRFAMRQEPPPQVGIVASMPGEPAEPEHAAARLVRESCERDPKAIDDQVAAMRKEVDAAFQQWRADQVECNVQRSLEREEERRWRDETGYGWRVKPMLAAGDMMAGMDISTRSGPSPRASAPASKGSAPEASRYSKTNDQVAGVDEADIVKTDGRYVYLVSSGALRILTALDPKVVSSTRLPGTAREMVVDGDRAVVLSSLGNASPRCTYGYDCQFGGDGTTTVATVLDLSDREHPRIARTLEVSGALLATRRIGKALHLVASSGDLAEPGYATWPPELEPCTNWEPGARAAFAKLKRDNERMLRARRKLLPSVRDQGTGVEVCNELYRTRISDGRAFTMVVSFDMTNDRRPPTTAMVQSRPGAVYASTDALYFAVTHRRSSSSGDWYGSARPQAEVSEVHKFRVGADPGATTYVGSGTVPGHVLNQFAMDEWYGYLRVVTSVGRVPDPNVSSSVSILAETPNHDLVRVGAIDRMAPGEDVRAVRFDGSRGYLVTFKKTDPLFVVELRDPRRPLVLGELKIPGFSTYLHRVDPDHLLSIGFDADDHGEFAYFNGLLLQLFDVTRPTEPRLLHREKIGTRGSSSEAATNHLAFNFMADTGTLAIPATVCEGGGDGSYGNELTFSGLLVYDVSLERGFVRLGGIDHGTRGASCSTWWSSATSHVKRSLFVDDLVYSIAEDRVKVQRLGRFGRDVADLSLLR